MGSCSDHSILGEFTDTYKEETNGALWVQVNENNEEPDAAHDVKPSADRCGAIGAAAKDTVATLTVHDGVVVDGAYLRMITINLDKAQAQKLVDVLARRLREEY